MKPYQPYCVVIEFLSWNSCGCHIHWDYPVGWKPLVCSIESLSLCIHWHGPGTAKSYVSCMNSCWFCDLCSPCSPTLKCSTVIHLIHQWCIYNASSKHLLTVQAITRQWMRLGLHLELSQLLGIFYSHIGFYMNQCLVNRATKAGGVNLVTRFTRFHVTFSQLGGCMWQRSTELWCPRLFAFQLPSSPCQQKCGKSLHP